MSSLLAAWLALVCPAAFAVEDAPPLTAFGLVTSPAAEGLRLDYVVPDSTAWDLGLRAEDGLLDLLGARIDGPQDARRALAAWKPETRLWAVVRRGGEIRTLQGALPRLALAAPRGPQTLSPLEQAQLASEVRTAATGRDALLRSLATPHVSLPPGRRAWVRFPRGLPESLGTGDVVEARWATGIAADDELDYLALRPGSRAWAQVAQTGWTHGVRTLRLVFYRLEPLDGHPVPFLATLVDASGNRMLTRVSSGGTLVTAEEGGPSPNTLFQLELRQPLTLYEAPDYFRAGVGLWLRERGSGKTRTLEVAQLAPERSARVAGAQEGDVLVAIDGTSAARLDLAEALDRLYGPAGSQVRVTLSRGGVRLPTLGPLARGTMYRWEDVPTVPARGTKLASYKRRVVPVLIPPPYHR